MITGYKPPMPHGPKYPKPKGPVMFPTADAPWVPTLLEIEMNKANEDDGSRTDWRKYGWSALYLNEKDCPFVTQRWTELEARFINRYAYRMINQETLERWQTRLQNRFDEVVNRYERAYRLYEEYKDTLDENVMKGKRTTIDHTISDTGMNSEKYTGSDTNSGKNKYSDTPDSDINESDNYAGSVQIQNYTQTYGRNKDTTINQDSSGHVLKKEYESGPDAMDSFIKNIRSYVDIDTAFIAEFENNFMNVYWY